MRGFQRAGGTDDDAYLGKFGIQGKGPNSFVPKKTKFWTLKPGTIATTARMCARCGTVVWFGDVKKLSELRTVEKGKRGGEDAT